MGRLKHGGAPGWCLNCSRVALPGRRRCDVHLWYQREVRRESYRLCRELGRCTNCIKAKARPGRCLCEGCAARASAA